ncbi:phage tail tape measure protein [Mycolicibacterium cosmeticum]|uniref:phage tail tape measure protein n=1 Tax=Mycolicibacterium cosmeticum TaxID=258533 RepID=UPI00320463AC
MPILLDVGAKADAGSFKQVADQAEKFFGGAGKSASGAFSKAFADGAKDVRKSTDAYTKAYGAIVDSAGKAKVAEAQRQQQLNKSESLTKAAAKAEKELAAARDAGNTKAVSAAERELERIKDQQTRTTTALIKASESVARIRRDETRQVRETVSAYRELQDAQRRAASPGFGRSFDSYSRGQGGVFGGALSQSSGIVGQFQNLGGSAGKGFVAGAAAAIVAGSLVDAGAKAAGLVVDGFKSVMDAGLDFSKTVNDFQGATQASALDTQQMAAAARALGADTNLAGVSSSDAAAAMTELAKAGFSVNDAISAARGTMQLATAAQIDGAQAAEVQANAINAFGLSANDAAHVADVLANAAVGSSADIPDIALALQQVGGVSKGFGENIEDTAAALGMFANAGIKGSDAGTLLKTTLQSITDQGNPAQGAIQNLGLSLYNFSTGQFVGFRELFRQLDEAKARMSPEAFQANANVLFGTDAMRAAMLGNVQSFDKMLAKIYEVGTAEDVAKSKMQGWPGIVEGVKNSLGEVKLSLYDIFDTPAGKDFGKHLVDGASGLVDWVRTHKPEIIGFVSDFVSAWATGSDIFLTYVARMLEAGSYLQDTLSHTVGTILEGTAKLAQGVGSVIKYIPGLGMALGPKLEGAGKAVDDIVDKWQNLGSSMRSGADSIDALREGIRGVRDEFTAAALNAIASEEANRNYANSFKEVAGSIEQIPGTKDFVIKDNSPEVLEKLRSLGFAVNNLPDGRQVIRIDYRDSAGNPLSPEQVSKMLGYNTQSFASAGDAQRARRGQDYNTPSAAAAIAAAAPPPATVGAPGTGTMPGSSGGGGGKQNPKFDESLWRVPVPGFVASAGIPGVADPQKVYDAQTAELNARNNLEQSKLKLLQLDADNTTDQLALLSAKNQVQENERAWTKAQRELIDAQNGVLKNAQSSTKSLADGMGQIGAALDDDLGFSKGLPGIAENLTRFLASLAVAPAVGALSAVVAASGGPQASGSGLVGILAAQGAFGSQYTAQGLAAANGGGFPAAVGGGQPYGLPNGTDIRQGAAGFPPWVYQVANAFGLQASTYAGHQEDKGQGNQGIDWWGPVENRQRFAEWLAQNRNMPGLEDVIFENPQTGQDIGVNNGRLVGTPGSEDPGYFRRGHNDFADHTDHVHTTQSRAFGLPGATQATASLNGLAAAANSAAGAIGTPPNGQWSADWLAMAQKESGGDWAADTGNGFQGGLQFTPDSWRAAGGTQYAPSANLATPYQQALTAENLLTLQGPGAWPNTYTSGSTGPAPDVPATPGLGPIAANAPGANLPLSAYQGGGGNSPVFATPQGPPSLASPGQPYPAQGGGGGSLVGGLALDAAMGATSALDAMMPGAGAAAKIGIQLLNRTAGYVAQNVGIGASGLLETLSVGDNPKGSLGAGWLGKALGGLAGARPALPNMAGQKPPTPAQQQGGNVDNSQVNNITLQPPKGTSADTQAAMIAEHTRNMYATPGRQ